MALPAVAGLQLHCSRLLCVSLFAQSPTRCVRMPMQAWICYLLQGQKGRLEKAIFECVLLAGSLFPPLLSGSCVFLGKFSHVLCMWLSLSVCKF